jgi:hypothetical protein
VLVAHAELTVALHRQAELLQRRVHVLNWVLVALTCLLAILTAVLVFK